MSVREDLKNVEENPAKLVRFGRAWSTFERNVVNVRDVRGTRRLCVECAKLPARGRRLIRPMRSMLDIVSSELEG